MSLKKLTYIILVLLCVHIDASGTSQRDYLEIEDIHGIMGKMFDQHIERRKMTPELMRRALSVYLNQFDPQRLYLLKGEVSPYLEPTDEQVAGYVEAYRNNDYRVFVRLNTLIQNSIERARSWRAEYASELDVLFEEAAKEGALRRGLLDNTEGKRDFADDEEQLEGLLRDDFIRFIAGQRIRLGVKAMEGKEERVLTLYERRIQSGERKYLLELISGKDATEEDREHFTVLHILKALASSLDAHSAFFDSGEAYDMRVRLEKGFKGIGVVLQESIDGVVIVRLIDGGPAERSGKIKENDRLVEVAGQSVIDMPFRAVLDLIRGEEGSVVKLGLKRLITGDSGVEREEYLNVRLKRERVVVSESRVDVETFRADDGIIGVIKLHAFYEGENGVSSDDDVRRALRDLHKKGRLRGVVLDLRQNTGGFLSQAVKVAGLFISNGVVVISQYSDGYERVFRDIDGYTYYNGPLIVLTSKASASAAEIVAQALQDYGAAIVVGDEQTYGKGSIQHQTVTDESSTSFFKVTVGKFYTVSGRSTQIRGVQADIVVPSPYHREPIGERYLDFALGTDTIDPSYADDLSDVDAGIQYWYRKYYLPSLQKRSFRWHNLLPQLRANSISRLASDDNFQRFLHSTGDSYQKQLIAANEELDPTEELRDLQLEEAVNIVNDMILLKAQAQSRQDSSSLKGDASALETAANKK